MEEDFILYWANLGWGLLVSFTELLTLKEAAKLSARSSKPGDSALLTVFFPSSSSDFSYERENVAQWTVLESNKVS